MMRALWLGLLFAMASTTAFAQSTINPALPAAGLPYSSSVVRNQFISALNDINALYSTGGAITIGTTQILLGHTAPSLAGLTSLGITGATASTTPANGAFVNAGGMGVAGQVNIGAVAADWANGGFFASTFGIGVLASSTMNMLNSTNVQNALFSTHTTNVAGFGFPSEAISASCVADWPSSPQTCWAIYAESVFKATANSTTVLFAQENDANNLNSAAGTALHPSSSSTVSGNFVNTWLAAGGSAAGVKYDITAYLGFVNNGAAAKSGLVVTCAALVRTGGTACSDNPGIAEAFALYEGDNINWYAFGGSAPKVRFSSQTPAAGNATDLIVNSGIFTVKAAGMSTAVSMGQNLDNPTFGKVCFTGTTCADADSGVGGGGGASDIFVSAAGTGTGHLRVVTTDSLSWTSSKVKFLVPPEFPASTTGAVTPGFTNAPTGCSTVIWLGPFSVTSPAAAGTVYVAACHT